MKHRLLVACLSLLTSVLGTLYATTAHADVMPVPGGPRIADCSKARDPARCQARIEARRACRDKRGDAKRSCMEVYVVEPDCARSGQPQRCIAQKQAEHTCSGKQGKALKACVQAELKKKKSVAKRPAPSTPHPAAANTSFAPNSDLGPAITLA